MCLLELSVLQFMFEAKCHWTAKVGCLGEMEGGQGTER